MPLNEIVKINDVNLDQATAFPANTLYLVTNTKKCLWKNPWPAQGVSGQSIYFYNNQHSRNYKYLIFVMSITSSINDGISIKKVHNPCYTNAEYPTKTYCEFGEMDTDGITYARLIQLNTDGYSCYANIGYTITITGTRTSSAGAMVPLEIWGSNE